MNDGIHGRGTEPGETRQRHAASGGLHVLVRQKTFPDGATVFDGLEFKIDRGEFVALLGPSGCGKTTALRLIAGLDTEYDGQILSDGIRIRGPGPDRGIVFQESRLLPWLTVEQNVAFALPSNVPRVDRTHRVAHTIQLVGLTSSARAWPYQLSGGMEKRAALARALVNLPSMLLMDEPLAAVDPFVRLNLQDEVARIHTREQLTTLLVTHDVDEAVHLSDRVLVLSGHPARVNAEIPVDLPRPRSRSALATLTVRQQVWEAVLASDSVGGG